MGEKRSSKNTKHTTVLAFPIRAKRKRKRRTKRDAKETNAHRRLLRARRKERRAFFFRRSSFRAFSLSPYRSRELESVIGRKDFSLEKKRALSLGREGGGSPSHLSKKEDIKKESALSRKRRGRESESPLKKRRQKKGGKKDG